MRKSFVFWSTLNNVPTRTGILIKRPACIFYLIFHCYTVCQHLDEILPDRFEFYFTPNGDGLNDIFLPQIRCSTSQPLNYCMSIFNRRGEKLFSTTDRTQGWDGTLKGKYSGSEVFSWVIRYDINRGQGVEHKNASGTVVIIR